MSARRRLDLLVLCAFDPAVDVLVSHRVAPPPCHAPGCLGDRRQSGRSFVVAPRPRAERNRRRQLRCGRPPAFGVLERAAARWPTARPGAAAAASKSVLHRQRVQADAGEDGVRGIVAGRSADLPEQFFRRSIELYRQRLGCAVAGIPNTGLDQALFVARTPRAAAADRSRLPRRRWSVVPRSPGAARDRASIFDVAPRRVMACRWTSR